MPESTTADVATYTADVDHLQTFFDTMASTVDEARVRFGPEQIEAEAVDPANVSYVRSEIPLSSDSDGEGTTIGLNIKRVQSLFEGFFELGDAEIRIDEQAQHVSFEVARETYTTPYIDPDSVRECNRPDPDFGVSCRLPVAEMERAVDLDCWGPTAHPFLEIRVSSPDALLTTVARHDDEDRRHRVEGISIEDGSNQTISAVFSIHYFTELVGVVDYDRDLRIELGTDHPIRISTDDGGEVLSEWAVAPRIGGGD